MAEPNSGSLSAEFAELHDLWSPRVIADLNGQSLKVSRVQGELAWHDHADEDELFLVWQGSLVIEYRDRPSVRLGAGDFHVVPRGVQHNPVADEECLLLLFEPSDTKHTGDVVTDKTRTIESQRRHLSSQDLGI